MYRAKSRRAAPAPVVHVDDAERGACESYAVNEEQSIPILTDDDVRGEGVQRATESRGWLYSPL